jgi:hypothetical protein
MWISAAVAVVAIAPMTLEWAFHDELFYTGHMSMTAAIQNGSYPPRSLSFPAFDLRYHYGFALLNAALTSILRVRIDTGIDLIGLASWGYLFVLFWAMGDRLLGRGRGWITATVTLFGGGGFFLCAGTGTSAASTLLGLCSTGGINVNPPFVSYFFQHPWAIGLPIGVALLATFYSEKPSVARYPTIGMLLVVLGICQFVLFAALAAALVVAEVFDRKPVSIRQGLIMLGVSATSLGVVTRLGGFFAEAPAGSTLSLVAHPGVANGVLATTAWHAATYGLLLPLGLIGVLQMKRGRALVLCLVAGSLAIINTVRYPYSWDILKFATLASLGLSVAATVAIAHTLDLRPARRAILAGGAALLGSAAGGLVFVFVMTVDLPGIPENPFSRSPAPVSRDDAAAISWLRRNVEPGQIVYRDHPQALSYAQWGGLPQVWIDDMVRRFGTPVALLEDRTRLLRQLPAAPDDYLNRGIAWFVLDPDDSRLLTLAQRWLDAGRAVVRANFGQLRVIELQ